ncbi:hypothetical protein E8P82_03715 [Arthrobacter echini]|uniref:Uncharacterized protein n=1 Tax=Arthrobacter echini TaxID=1529066 RepID=A0A4S5E8F0_9MICC|nr:hypothetical protein [Arthrobacter echini]THJ67941.1 hypothetical protein E8P82_03715 [Arthrobacter echini]
MTQQGTGRGGPVRAAEPQQGPPDDAAARGKSARSWLRLFVLALLAGVLMSALALPWKVLALVVSVFALAAGVVGLVKAIGARLPRLVVIATSLGLAAALFLSVSTAVSVLLWPVTRAYEDCVSRALTLQARSDCEDALRRFDTAG